MTAKYDDLFVFTDKAHPKRGHRRGQHFHITGRYKDIIHVFWHNTKERGYVREGEFMAMNEFNRAFMEREKYERKMQQDRLEMEERLRLQKEADDAYHRKLEALERLQRWLIIREANAFRLVHTN